MASVKRPARASDELSLDSLGATPQAALRHLVDEFERRGWRDDGTSALAIVRVLEAHGGAIAWRKAIQAVPGSFLASNHVRRTELESALREATLR
jgi:hypothetical protein